MSDLMQAITIRPGYGDDHHGLWRLAALDSADAVPAAPLLVAEVDGELWVALSLSDGSVIADPFHPTAHLVSLLRARAAAVTQPAPQRRTVLHRRLRFA